MKQDTDPVDKHTFWGRLGEGVFLFIGIPLIEFTKLNPFPKLTLLILVGIYCGWLLWHDSTFTIRLRPTSGHHQASKTILLRLLFVIPALLGLVWVLNSQHMLMLPYERPYIWMRIMILYPLFSALPQEFIYRTFFFHRYQHFFHFKYSGIILSACAFSFLHLVYDNWLAIGLSFIGGLLFGITYKRTQSLFWITVEHIIYGWLVFTIGLGNFFYEGF